MNWNKADLESFFGCRADAADHNPALPAFHFFHYATPRLRYAIIINEDTGQVSVSADPETPFGGDSLYEIHAHCDTIGFYPDDNHKDFQAIGFWKGDSRIRENLRFTIMKRRDGDLKIWEAFFPTE